MAEGNVIIDDDVSMADAEVTTAEVIASEVDILEISIGAELLFSPLTEGIAPIAAVAALTVDTLGAVFVFARVLVIEGGTEERLVDFDRVFAFGVREVIFNLKNIHKMFRIFTKFHLIGVANPTSEVFN
jgi:hypothetical protein